MSKEIYEEVREWVKDPQHGSKNYGKLGALPQYVRDKIHRLCDFAESADKMVMSYLTPPTEQEVCEALGEYLKEPVWLDDNGNIRIATQWVVNKIYLKGKYAGLNIQVVLPPHLITLIGRFYEGKVKE